MTTPTTDAGSAAEHPRALARVIGPKLLLLFIIGDVLGAGVYAVTGEVVATAGGLAWVPFVIAFAVAGLTAWSYLALVTTYPQAAGAALYVHKAFGVELLTFVMAFAVVSSGIASAATAAKLFASNLLRGLEATVGDGGARAVDVPTGSTAATVTALVFMLLLAVVNLWGVRQSLVVNVVLTIVEALALVIVILVGLWATGHGEGDLSRLTQTEVPAGAGGALAAITIATALAFFAMVGFEDSVNMVEETKDPRRSFPRALVTGLGVAALLYVLVAVATVSVLSQDQVAAANATEAGVLLAVVEEGLPEVPIGTVFPFLTVFAVANTALINMLMASRLVYGMARQDVLPHWLGRVSVRHRSPWAAVGFTTLLALALVVTVGQVADSTVTTLAGTTGLLLLGVFALVNASAFVTRREAVAQRAVRMPGWAAVVATLACLYLAGPWARDRSEWIQYQIAAAMVVVGLCLWGTAHLVRRPASRRGRAGPGSPS